MSQTATYLKVGTTAIVLAMIEDGAIGTDLGLAHPVAAIRQVSHDPTLRQTVLLRNGQRMTGLDVQWSLLEWARKYERSHGLECVGEKVGSEVLRLWEDVLDGLSTDPSRVAGQVDWVAKKRLVDGFAERHALSPGHAKLKAIDLQYHDMRPERGLAGRVGLDDLIAESEVEAAISDPPESTRAYFRGRCLARWPESVVAANWDSIVFDVGRDPLRRVPMMEPLRGTKALVGDLLEGSTSVTELLDRLGSGG
jgi:proteasome accessory factor A